MQDSHTTKPVRFRYLKVFIGISLTFTLNACVSNKHKGEQTALEATLICNHADRYSGLVVGDGECVSLIKACSGSGDTEFWRPGKKVLGNLALTPGSVIATFKDGRYPNKSGYHAAIYISHNQQGIWVWDQWRGKAVHKRLIPNRKGGEPSNSAQAYRLVKTLK